MHKALADKLRLHLAGKDVTWTEDAATWTDEGGRHLTLLLPAAPTAQALVDAHLRARESDARLTVLHEGAPTAVALRTAARFSIALLDAATLPAPAEAEPVIEGPAAPEPAAPLPLIPEPQAPVEDAFIIAHDEPAPEVAHAEPDTPLPWDPTIVTAEPVAAHVEPVELLALPWIDEMHAHEELPAGREPRHGGFRATMAPQMEADSDALRAARRAPDWGLPWPRPVVPTDGLSKADPAIWRAPERIAAVREDLARAGAPSFGAVKPEGSAWLKRLGEFPAP